MFHYIELLPKVHHKAYNALNSGAIIARYPRKESGNNFQDVVPACISADKPVTPEAVQWPSNYTT